jgi:uncharacterized membrane protein YtjA (UPF0391 family)
MLRLAVAFLIVALIAAYFGGFGGISDHSWKGANTLFFLCVILGLLSVLGRVLKWPYA